MRNVEPLGLVATPFLVLSGCTSPGSGRELDAYNCTTFVAHLKYGSPGTIGNARYGNWNIATDPVGWSGSPATLTGPEELGAGEEADITLGWDFTEAVHVTEVKYYETDIGWIVAAAPAE